MGARDQTVPMDAAPPTRVPTREVPRCTPPPEPDDPVAPAAGAASIALTGAIALGLGASPPATQAQDPIPENELRELLSVKIRTVQHLALNPVVVRATRRQNEERMSLTDIQTRDEAWRQSESEDPFKVALQTSRAGRLLRRFVERSGSFNEAFLTDNQGANVAAFPATSDYWQGDEEKWTESFRAGQGRVFIGELELDESTQTYAVQVSAPVLDRERTIGVLVVGVTFGYLEARRR